MLEAINLKNTPKLMELLPLLEAYAEINAVSLDTCLTEAVACWLTDIAHSRMLDKLCEAETRARLFDTKRKVVYAG